MKRPDPQSFLRVKGDKITKVILQVEAWLRENPDDEEVRTAAGTLYTMQSLHAVVTKKQAEQEAFQAQREQQAAERQKKAEADKPKPARKVKKLSVTREEGRMAKLSVDEWETDGQLLLGDTPVSSRRFRVERDDRGRITQITEED